jgi:hypothetical protein
MVTIHTASFNVYNLCVLFTQCICYPYDRHNRQQLFIQTELTRWTLQRRRNVFPVRHELNAYTLLG